MFDMYIFNSFHLLHSYNPSFLIRLCFNMASLRDQKKLGLRPDRSPLGVYFKISDENPHPRLHNAPSLFVQGKNCYQLLSNDALQKII